MTEDSVDDLDCHVASRLISDALDGAVSAGDQECMRRHFVICQACRNVKEQMNFLRHAIRQMTSETTR